MASSVPCGCDTEEQTVDDVVLQCPIHRAPHGLHGLMVLDDETIEWLLNTRPEILYSLAVVMKNCLIRRRAKIWFINTVNMDDLFILLYYISSTYGPFLASYQACGKKF